MMLTELAHAEEEAYLDTLARLVSHESPTHDKSAVDTLADHLEKLLRADGWEVERQVQAEVGDQLIAGWEAPGDTATLLLTHFDTVWPKGTLTAMPFRRDGDRVYGPGTADMKAGIATAIHALRLVKSAKLSLRGPVTLLLTSDEEAGSLHSRALIEKLALEHQRTLVLEPSRDDGALKVGRKGVGGFQVRFHGRSAHAGNNPEDGASALRELAHFLFFAEGLNDPRTGTSVNVTVACGGTVSNVIAEEAEAQLDIRILDMAEGERVERAIRNYSPHDPRGTVNVVGGINRPPLEFNEANQALYREAEQALRRLGLHLEKAVVGGGSDGSFTSALGIPTLDGLGCVGAGPHARHEHIRVRGTLERLALLTALLTRPD